jgi:hypothetical protein
VAGDLRQRRRYRPATFRFFVFAALIKAIFTPNGSLFLITTARKPPSQPGPRLSVILISEILGIVQVCVLSFQMNPIASHRALVTFGMFSSFSYDIPRPR